ncbi:MAG: hypothetical protein LBQ24_07105 [Candidatus Peribacteria bacterium]|nr:hypothetical protein [Candidatus Peribacteria bacterium]
MNSKLELLVPLPHIFQNKSSKEENPENHSKGLHHEVLEYEEKGLFQALQNISYCFLFCSSLNTS